MEVLDDLQVPKGDSEGPVRISILDKYKEMRVGLFLV